MFYTIRRSLFNPLLLLIASALLFYLLIFFFLDSPWYVLPYNLANLFLASALLIAGLLLIISPRFAIFWFLEIFPPGLADQIEIKDDTTGPEWWIMRLFGFAALAVGLFVAVRSIAGLLNILLAFF